MGFGSGRQFCLHILADDVEGLIVVATGGHTADHLITLLLHPGLLQQAGSAAHDAEDIAVLAQQFHFGFLRRLFLRYEAAQPVGDVVGQPCAAELPVGLDAPHGQPAHVQLDSLEGEQQVGQAAVLENGHVLRLERAAVLQDARLGEQLVDAVHPLLKRPAAALEDETLLILHAPQVVCGDLLYRVIAHAGTSHFSFDAGWPC